MWSKPVTDSRIQFYLLNNHDPLRLYNKSKHFIQNHQFHHPCRHRCTSCYFAYLLPTYVYIHVYIVRVHIFQGVTVYFQGVCFASPRPYKFS